LNTQLLSNSIDEVDHGRVIEQPGGGRCLAGPKMSRAGITGSCETAFRLVRSIERVTDSQFPSRDVLGFVADMVPQGPPHNGDKQTARIRVADPKCVLRRCEEAKSLEIAPANPAGLLRQAQNLVSACRILEVLQHQIGEFRRGFRTAIVFDTAAGTRLPVLVRSRSFKFAVLI